MREISASEARKQLGQLLDQVGRGVEILISRRGRVIARLVPIEPDLGRANARRAVAGILELSRGASLGGLKIKDLITEGRP